MRRLTYQSLQRLGISYSRALDKLGFHSMADELNVSYANEAEAMRRVILREIRKRRNLFRNVASLVLASGKLRRYNTKDALRALQKDRDFQEALLKRLRVQVETMVGLGKTGKESPWPQT